MTRYVPIAGLILALVVANVEAAPASPLDADSRLDVPVTIARPYATNAQLLRELGEKSGVKLTATGSLAARCSALVAAGTPLRQLLLKIAEAGDYAWRGEGMDEPPVYTLTESGEAARRAEAARAREREAGLAAVDQQVELMIKYVRAFAGGTQREAYAEAARLREVADALPTSRERYLAEAEAYAASRAVEPDTRALALAYHSLAADARARVAHGERVLMAIRYPGAVTMPAEVARALRDGRAWQAARRRGNPVPVDPDANEVLSFTSSISPMSGSLRIAVRAQRYGAHPTAPELHLPGYTATPSRAQFAPAPPSEPRGKVTADFAADLTRPVPYRLEPMGGPRKRTRQDLVTFVTGITPGEIIRGITERESRLKLAGDSVFRALTPDLSVRPPVHPRAALEALSSQYRSRPPLGEVLNVLADRGALDIHLSREGWITMRSLLPHQRDAHSIDPTWLAETFGDLAEGPARFTPALARRAVAGLTAEQGQALGRFELGFLRDVMPPNELGRGYAGWRLLAGMSPGRASSLVERKALRYGELAPPEQAAFRAFVQQVSADPDGALLDVELDQLGLANVELAYAREVTSTSPEAQLAFAQRGATRIFEVRLSRPPLVLHQFSLACHWEAP